MTTLYLKHRPKLFADLDSAEARDTLLKLFTHGNIPHALLLTGSKGIGKTSAARIIAKSLVCEQKPATKETSFEPCNLCPSCLSVDMNSNLDILEIDAASNRGIDDARDLKEKIRLAPAQGKYKIFIIDEVHMLTTESFNALLKTLEEPPKHAYFILCTTDFEKLPKTIVSRCTRINFKKATQKELLDRLIRVAKIEEIEYDEQGLAVLAHSCEGSFRDAIKLLEQASSQGKVTQEIAMKVVGLNNDYPISMLLTYLEKEQIKEALEWVSKASETNLNFKLIIQEMVETLRQLMLKSFGVPVEAGLNEYVFSLDQIKVLVRLLTVANYELRQSPVASLPLEMAIIDYLSSASTVIAGGGDEVGKSDGESTVLAIEQVEDDKTVTVLPAYVANTNLDSSWPAILEEVKPLNHSVLAFLRASRPLSLDDKGHLTIEVFYKFHKDQLEMDRSRKIFEMAASKVLACEVKLKCILGQGKPLVAPKEEPVYEVCLDAPLPNKQPEDIINIAEQIFNNSNNGTIQ